MKCESNLCEIITETIFPSAGILTSYFIFFSPLGEINNLRKTRSSKINPFPSVMIICNCLCWIIYSFVTENHWVFWPNLGGILLGEYYVLVLFSSNLNIKQFNRSTLTLLTGTFLNVAGGFISFIALKDDREAGKNVMGIVCIIILCAMYVSPLATFYDVMKTKCSGSINILLTFASLINGLLWVVYGLFFNDFYVWFPNGMGVLSAGIQVFLICVFPRKIKVDEVYNTPTEDNVLINSKLSSDNSQNINNSYHSNYQNSEYDSPNSETGLKGNTSLSYV